MKEFYYNAADFTVDNIIANHPDVDTHKLTLWLKSIKRDWQHYQKDYPTQAALDLRWGMKILYARVKSYDKLHLFIGCETHGEHNPIIYKSLEAVE